jgi:heptosyltransferase-2
MTIVKEQPLPAATEVRTITALMLGEIGDLIVTTPTLAALRERYPQARLRVIVRRAMAELLASNPAVDELLLYDSRSRWTKIAFLGRLALMGHDLWVDLHTPTFNTWNTNDEVFRRNRLFMRAARPRFQLAFEMAPLRGRITHPVAVPEPATLRDENIVDTTLRLVGGSADRRKRLVVAAADSAWAQAELARRRIDQAPCIGLFFGAKQSAKVWPLQRTAALCAGLPQRFPQATFLILGGPHEVDAARELLAGLPAESRPRFHDLTATGGLGRSAALIARCAALVATDSGPMHMADALGVELVALMSAHNHAAVWRPLRAAAVLRTEVACSPCFSADCVQGQACMLGIEAEPVMAALAQALSRARA